MTYKILAILLCLQLSTQNCHGKLEPIGSKENQSKVSLNECIIELSKQFFPARFQTITVSFTFYVNYTSVFSLTQMIIVELMELNRWSVMVDNTRSTYTSHLHKMPSGYIIQMKQYSDLATAVAHIISTDRFGKFIIVFEEVTSHADAVASEIIQILIQAEVISATVLIPDPDNTTSFRIYPWAQRCGIYKSFKGSQCSFGRIQMGTRSKGTQEKCTVRALYYKWAPFVVDPEKDLGIEVSLLNTVTSALNLDITYQPSNNGWGRIVNDQILGDFVLLINNTVDIVVGGYTANHKRRKYFDVSPSYTNEKLVWCVPHQLQMESLGNIGKVFDVWTWVCILLIYLAVSTIVWYFSRRNETTAYKYFTTSLQTHYAILIGIAIHALPGPGKVRALVVIFAVLAIFLTTIFSSYLTSVLSTPVLTEKYSSVKQIFDANLRVHIVDHSFTFFQHVVPENVANHVSRKALIQRLVNCTEPVKCLEMVTNRTDSAVCMSEQHKNYLFKKDFPNKHMVHCLDSEFLTYSINLIFRRGFPFRDRINDMIRRITSSGYITKWRNDLTYDRKNTIQRNDPQGATIQLVDLKPIFLFICCCYGFSILVFFLEVAWHRTKSLKSHKLSALDYNP